METTTADRIFKPANKFQEEFLDSKVRFLLAQGGRQSGKSYVGAIKSIIQATTHPESQGLVIAPTYVDLRDVNVPMMMKLLPDGWVRTWSKIESRMTLRNGSIITFRAADKPEKFGRGRTLDWFWWDEPSFAYEGLTMWQSLQPALTVKQARGWFTCTPKGRDWVFKEIRKKAESKDKDYKCWTFTSYDNPYIPKESLERAKKDMSEKMYRQEIMAEIVDFVGLVYPDFDEKKHTYDVLPKEKDGKEMHYQYFVGIDVGYTNPTAVSLIAKDIDNNLYLEDEIYESGMSSLDIVTRVRDMVKDRPIVTYIIDPASRGIQQTSFMSMMGQLEEHGLYCEPGDNDVTAGINRMTELIRANKFHVNRKCENFLHEIANYSWEEGRSEHNLPERPKKKDDHLLDNVRYVAMWRPDYAMPDDITYETEAIDRGEKVNML